MEHIAVSQPSLEAFWQRLRSTTERVLMLDYDGTLAPFTTTRDQARPYPEVQLALEQLCKAGHTRIVIISGRPVSEILALLPGASALELFGSHGLEHRQPDGTYSLQELDPVDENTLDAVMLALQQSGLRRQLERKPGSLAVHWRGESSRTVQEILEAITTAWGVRGRDGNLDLRTFDGGIEIRSYLANKGNAVTAIRAETGPAAVMAFLGDDHTDEDAFLALGQDGLSVLVRPQFRSTAARCWLVPPAGLVQFLTQWHAACSLIEPRECEFS
jgi:trehalose 6-phosphate phosphatase